MTGEEWIAGVRAGLLNAQALYGEKKMRSAVVAMAPATASRGLLLCGLRDLDALAEAVGAPLYLSLSLPAGEYLILDGEKIAKGSV